MSFEVLAAGRVVCTADAHVLAERFPTDDFWEYCCDCECFYTLGLAREARAKNGVRADRCLVCESDQIRHYVCAECNVISHKSRDSERGIFSISATGLVRPSCPGCLTVKSTSVLEHACSRLSIVFTTARTFCPFCKKGIVPESHVAGLLGTASSGGAAVAVVEKSGALTVASVRAEKEGETASLVTGDESEDTQTEPVGFHPLEALKRFGRWAIVFYHERKAFTISGLVGLLLGVAGLLLADPIYESFLNWKNHPPSVKIIRPSPPKINIGGGSATLTAIAEDRDGDKLDYEWKPSAGRIDGSGETVTLVLAESDGVTGDVPIKVWVYVRDKYEGEDKDWVEVGVFSPPQNQSPRLTDLRAEKQSVTVGERVQLMAVAEDPDRENLTYQWSPSGGIIENNGHPVVFLNTEGVSVASGEVKIKIILTVKDPRDLAVSNNLEITVQPGQTAENPTPTPTAPSNKSPFFLLPPPEEADVTAGESLGLEAYAMDPDGDELEYVWTAQKGKIEGTGTSVRLNTSDLNPAKSTLRSLVTLTVKDRKGASTSGVVSIRVIPAEPPQVEPPQAEPPKAEPAKAEPVPAPRPEPTPAPTTAPP